MAKRRSASRPPDQILAEALDLPLRERARLVESLIASLEDSAADDADAVERAWTVEVERRVAEIDAGRVKMRPARDVFRAGREHGHSVAGRD